MPGVETAKVLEAIKQIESLPHLRGVVMGTKGLGKGLDDQAMEPIWAAIAEAGLTVFVVSAPLQLKLLEMQADIPVTQHPHYGVEGAFGEQDNGHVLALALGFPFETTIVCPASPAPHATQSNLSLQQAIARLILFGTLDRHPTLRLLLAHSAGALPALSSRLASCVVHDPTVKDRLQHDFRYYLGMLYYDAVAYGPEELALVERTVARADKFEGKEERKSCLSRAVLPTVIQEADGMAFRRFRRPRLRRSRPRPQGLSRAARLVPRRRPDPLRFAGISSEPTRRKLTLSLSPTGTDHPFFPPLDGEGSRWKSVDENLDAIEGVYGWGETERAKVMGGNAVELFGLEL